MQPNKYVVVAEVPSTGYINCVAICDAPARAYGEAYLALCDGIGDDADDEYYITPPVYREGEGGMLIELKQKDTGETLQCVTVLFYYG